MMKTGTLISDMMSFPMYSRSLGHQALRSCVTRACAARGSQGRRSEAAYSEVPACLLLALKHVRPAAVRALGTGLHRYEVLVAQQAARRPRDEASQHWPTRLRLPRWPPAGCGKRTCSRSPPQIEQGCRLRWLCARSWRRQVAIRRLSCAWRATSQPSSSTAASQQQLSRHTHAERVGRERVGWGGAGGGATGGTPELRRRQLPGSQVVAVVVLPLVLWQWKLYEGGCVPAGSKPSRQSSRWLALRVRSTSSVVALRSLPHSAPAAMHRA